MKLGDEETRAMSWGYDATAAPPTPLKEAVKPEPQLAQRADEIASNAARRVACQMYDYEGRKATIKAALTEYAHALKER